MKKENLNESGRSMVEMLGVLAIIGVLSVMGIAGYKAAMTRHRANELLNEATKRAAVVAAQLSLQGLAIANLNEFSQNDLAGGKFSPAPITPENGRFQIEITGVDGAVCEQMKSTTSAFIKGFSPDSCDSDNPNTVKLTYKNDLSTDDNLPSGDNTPSGDETPSGDDTPAAESCPEARQCGDTCCGEDNECDTQTGQCCFGGNCCPVGSKGISTVNYECCEVSEDIVLGPSDATYCCPAGSTGYSNESGECCVAGTLLFEDDQGLTFCCPGDSTGFGDGCCEAGTIVIQDENDEKHCCPANSTGYDVENDECI